MQAGKQSGVVHLQNVKGYSFISFINFSSANIEVFQGIVNDKQYATKILTCPQFGQYTFPIEERPDFTLFWNRGQTADDETFVVILSTENLGFNSTYYPPDGLKNVTIVGDQVGLARRSQFPEYLSPGGGLSVEPVGPVDVWPIMTTIGLRTIQLGTTTQFYDSFGWPGIPDWLIIRADADNTQKVYVAYNDPSDYPADDLIPLKAGEEIKLYGGVFYAKADVADEKIHVHGIGRPF